MVKNYQEKDNPEGLAIIINIISIMLAPKSAKYMKKSFHYKIQILIHLFFNLFKKNRRFNFWKKYRAIQIAGIFSGPPDLAANHDDYLAESYSEIK